MTIELAYRVFGEGDPLLILHGLFGAKNNWATIAKQLVGNHQVFCLDSRNHGESPHVDSMSYLEMAEDLNDFMEQHQIEKASLVGHSMGGKIAMVFALNYPEKVNRLVIADIAPVDYPLGSFQNIIESMLTLPLEQITSRQEADQELAKRIDEPSLRLFLLSNLTRKENRFVWKSNLSVIAEWIQGIREFPKLAELSNRVFKERTLFLRGEKSDYVQNNHHELIYQLFPQTQIQEIENSGHWVHAENPKDFLQKLKQFLVS